MNYYRSQCARLGEAESYAIKLDNDGGPDGWAETKRMSINADQFRRIVEILAEGDDDV